ncbi:ABC transporter ATP-binding protein [Planotetraspora kaengkrachanensis]|uniref:ABC transporter ATP-binding protein n=2 Tax=Planotetraspora kaengkrachanensis TaxID=575193 RepID=A0A8J3PST7_9ACTN|nr:ABC transporter ATP-binding protein [Planotetraspora kaengkrachanensis]
MTDMESAALAVEDLSLVIDGAQILRDVTFGVAAGELVAVIGPNGAGKTSLLNVVSGTMRPTRGRVALHDRDVTRASPARRARLGLGRTFQTSYLFLGLTVLENVRLATQAKDQRFGGLWRAPGRSAAALAPIREHLARVGLDGARHTPAGSLSHGDRRKLELAIMLASGSTIVLLDEPMAGVNNEDLPSLMQLIRDVQRDTDATVVMVEHHIDVVLELAHRVAVMHHGALLAFDTPESVVADATVRDAYLGEPL